MTINVQLIQQQAHNPVIVSIISSTAVQQMLLQVVIRDNIEAARQRCSWEKYASNLQENTHVEV